MRDARARDARHGERGGVAVPLAFLVAFGLAFGGAWVVRSRTAEPAAISTTVAASTTTSTVVETTLAVPDTTLAPDTTIVDTTLPDTTVAPDTTAAPETTQPDLPGPPALGTAGAIVRRLGSEERRLYDQTTGCDGFTLSGAAQDCGAYTAGGVQFEWVIDEGGGFDLLALDPTADGGDVYRVLMRSDGTVSKAVVADVTGDGSEDLIVSRSTADHADFDVIEARDAAPVVTLHLAFDGRVRYDTGAVDVFLAVPGQEGALWAHYLLRADSGEWKARDEGAVADVGPTQV